MKLVSIIAVVALAGVAHADNKDKADALFKQGKKQMAEKRYADACESFEKSYKLDPGIGAQLNIAKCYEEWGKIGRAYTAYLAAEQLAKDLKDPREPKIHDLVVALEPSVPHLTIKLPKDATGVKVTLDNRPVDTIGEPFAIDPGPHTVEWTVKGSAKKSKIVAVDRGGDSEVTLDIANVASDADKGNGIATGGTGNPDAGNDKGPTADTPTPPGRNQRLGGIALAGGGVIAIGISSYLTLSAKSNYDDALTMYCGGKSDNCDMTGLEITHDARSTANTATVVFLVGAAMVGGGAALYFLAPKGPAAAAEQQSSFYLTPSVSPDGVGIVFGGEL
jgi:tetratricopeptide (TPR) repeat protein